MRFTAESKMAIRIKVNIVGDIDDYAKSFLIIYNNVKNDSSLLKVYNDYENGVYVVCETEAVDAATEFLKQFGDIVKTETVKVIIPIVNDIHYPNNYDLEFLDVEE